MSSSVFSVKMLLEVLMPCFSTVLWSWRYDL